MTKIVNYTHEYSDYFKNLNLEWLNQYFVPEPYDIEVLSNPKKYILNKGGQIFFVIDQDNIPKGTVALMYNEYNELELTKMAVSPSTQGKGYGNLLMQHCIDYAKEIKSNHLILYSNTKLEPAINLYRKFGFEEIPVEKSEYERCNIKMIKSI